MSENEKVDVLVELRKRPVYVVTELASFVYKVEIDESLRNAICSELARLRKVISDARSTFAEIQKGEGRFNRDQLTFACNTILDMRGLALGGAEAIDAALAPAQDKPMPDPDSEACAKGLESMGFHRVQDKPHPDDCQCSQCQSAQGMLDQDKPKISIDIREGAVQDVPHKFPQDKPKEPCDVCGDSRWMTVREIQDPHSREQVPCPNCTGAKESQ